MARPDAQSPHRHLPGIPIKLFLARAALAWEALWPALWPASGIAGLFLAISLFNVLPVLPGWTHALLLVAFAFCKLFLLAIKHKILAVFF